MSTPPETFSARFVTKTAESVFQHLLGWLPDGWAWRAKSISQGGKAMGVPDGSHEVGDQEVWIQGCFYPPFQIPTLHAGVTILRAPNGQLFTPTEDIRGNTGSSPSSSEIRPHPTKSGWAIVKMALANNGHITTGMRAFLDIDLGANPELEPKPYAPDLGCDDRHTPRTRIEYILGSAEMGFTEFAYELLDPVAVVIAQAIVFQVRAFSVNNAGPSADRRLMALEDGTAANLPEDTELVVINPGPRFPTLDDTDFSGLVFNVRVAHVPNNPSGVGFAGGEDPEETLLRLACRAFSFALGRAHQLVVDWMDELPGLEPKDVDAGILTPRIYGMRQTLEEWERYTGIPGDGCFPGPAEPDRDVRRRHVIVKMASLGVQTAQDFVDLAKILGVTILCQAGKDSNLYPTSLSEADARQTVVFTFFLPELLAFTYTFEDRGGPPADGLLFTDNTVAILQCLFEKLIPSTCQAKYLYVPT